MYRIAPDKILAYRCIVFLVAILAAFGFGWLAQQSPRSAPELTAEDALVRLAPHAARGDIVILALDDASVKKYGPIKSWPRSLLAKALAKVEAGKPKLVVTDLALTSRTHSGDEDLWRVMANKQNVALGMAYNADRPQIYTPDDIRSLVFLEKYAIAENMTFGPTTQTFTYSLFEPPVSDFTGSSRGVGVFIREPDPDGIIRDARLFYKSTVQYPPSTMPIKGKFPQSQLADGAPVALPNLALVSALRVFQLEKENVKVLSGDTVHLTGNINPSVDAPVDDQGRMLIRYAGPAGRYISYSFQDVVDDKVKPDVFADKTVIIGATAPDDPASDIRMTPFGRMYRSEITANALSTLLDRSYVGRYSQRVIGVMIFLGLITGLLLMFAGGGRTLVAFAALLLGYLAVCYGLYAFSHAILPIVPGLLVVLVTGVIAIALHMGPFKSPPLAVSETYVPPPTDAVHTQR